MFKKITYAEYLRRLQDRDLSVSCAQWWLSHYPGWEDPVLLALRDTTAELAHIVETYVDPTTVDEEHLAAEAVAA